MLSFIVIYLSTFKPISSIWWLMSYVGPILSTASGLKQFFDDADGGDDGGNDGNTYYYLSN